MASQDAPLSRRTVLGALIARGGSWLLAACGAPASPTAAPTAAPKAAESTTAAGAEPTKSVAPAPAPTIAPTVAAKPAAGAVFNLGFTPGEDAEEVLKRYKPVV